MKSITTFLTFEKDGKQAVDFYVSVFKNSHINSMMTMPDGNQLIHASFSLNGQDFMAMDGGAYFTFTDGISLFISCKDQAEVDYYWDKLSQGGKPGQCGWLKDKYGVSWQIIPKALGELMSDPDPVKSSRVRTAMLAMNKIEVAKLEQAYRG